MQYAPLLDFETLIDTLVRRDMVEAAFIGMEYDTTIVNNLPALIMLPSLAGQTGNGPGLWSGSLTVYIHGEPAEAFNLARLFYNRAHAWAYPGVGSVAGIGWVSKVEDITFDHSDTALVGGASGVQYLVQFGLTLRST